MNGKVIDAAARAAHEAIRALKLSRAVQHTPTWEAVSERDRQFDYSSVLRVAEGYPASELHAGWVRDMAREGWVYGAGNEPATRTHPHLVGWDDLPPIRRDEIILFGAVVRAMLSALRT